MTVMNPAVRENFGSGSSSGVEATEGGLEKMSQPASGETVRLTAAHPFLGFSGAPGFSLRQMVAPLHLARILDPEPDATYQWLDWPANNHGFFAPFDYPYEPGDGGPVPYIVGVFGGSVATWFAMLAGDALCADLNGNPLLRDRPPLVLSFAAGGMKQPQALMALNYFLSEGQRLDAVVLIDGFNEAALSYLNILQGYPGSVPSLNHLRYVDEALAPTRPPGIVDADAVARIVQHWAVSSRLMHDICRSQQIMCVQFLQPNQYHSGKSFTADELEWAVTSTSPYKRGVEAVYPLMTQQARELANAGLPVIDATSAFDQVGPTVYADSCCHYNLRGNLILKDIVVDALLMAKEPAGASRSAASLVVTSGASKVEPQPADRGPEEASGPSERDFVYPMW